MNGATRRDTFSEFCMAYVFGAISPKMIMTTVMTTTESGSEMPLMEVVRRALRKNDAERLDVKMFTTMHREGGGWCLALRVSPDGIHWSEPVAKSPGIGDRTTAFYNPFRKMWVMSLRIGLRP